MEPRLRDVLRDGTLAGFLVLAGSSPLAAQTSDQVQTDTRPSGDVAGTQAADPVAPGAEYSGWLDLGVWGIGAIVVIVALVAWFGFFRPRSRPTDRSGR